ncbi:class I SAM-dependent methyltransferase [Amycolatopsis lurida]
MADGGDPGPRPGLDARLVGYLLANRDFMAPAVEAAVASLALPPGARALDVGTGAGGALPALARAGAIVDGIDLNPAVIPVATEHAQRSGVADRVTVRVADVAEVTPESYDVIWASDVVWPGNFADPAQTVADLVGALAPGGVLTLFYGNYYRATFLPGHDRLERLIFAASELRWKLPADGPHRHDRHTAGLADVRLSVFPRVGFPVDNVVRAYLESVRACGDAVGLTAAGQDEIRALLTPGSERYVLDEPDYHVVHPTVLVSGRWP